MTTRILTGDSRRLLPILATGSVQCVVTSPPYFGLRNYGEAGQIGLEKTPAEYIAELVAVFREVRRVLRDDGTAWLNLGDSYCSAGGHSSQGATSASIGRANVNEANAVRGFRPGIQAPNFKIKDKMLIPHRVAIALQDDGWWVRQDNVWAKPNPMPESTTDRPTTAHEYVFLLTKSEHYFYDAEAGREDSQSDHASGNGFKRPQRLIFAGRGSDDQWNDVGGTRNMRSVWNISTKPFTGAHFATFPPELPERCIKVGTSEYGACPTCGAPWRRVVTKGEPDMAQRMASGADASGGYVGKSTKGHRAAGVQDASAVKARILEGMRERKSEWVQGCKHPPAPPVPCVVLDPFGGSGTTGLVADELRRDSILIELNPSYTAMAARRIKNAAPLTADVRAPGHA